MDAADKVTDILKSAWNFNPPNQPLISKWQLKEAIYPPTVTSLWVKFSGAVILLCKCKFSVQWRWVAVQSGSVNFQLCVNGDRWSGGHLRLYRYPHQKIYQDTHLTVTVIGINNEGFQCWISICKIEKQWSKDLTLESTETKIGKCRNQPILKF